MAPDRLSHETDSAVEQLLLKRNGEKKTVQDVFEVVVAMNHDRRADTLRLLGEIKANRAIMDRHLSEDARLTNAEFAEMIAGFDRKHIARDVVISEVKSEIETIQENCVRLHERAPRRHDDPETENWGRSVYGSRATDEDEELGDLRRAWRFLRWGVIVVGGAFLVAVGDHISHIIWPD